MSKIGIRDAYAESLSTSPPGPPSVEQHVDGVSELVPSYPSHNHDYVIPVTAMAMASVV